MQSASKTSVSSMRRLCLIVFIWVAAMAAARADSQPTVAKVISLAHAPSDVVVLPRAEKFYFDGPICRIEGATFAKVGAAPNELVINHLTLAPVWITLQMGTQSNGCNRPKPYRAFFSNRATHRFSQGNATIFAYSRLVEVTSESMASRQLLLMEDGRVVQSSICLDKSKCTVTIDGGTIRKWLKGGNIATALWASPLAPLVGEPVPSLLQSDGTWSTPYDHKLSEVRFEFGRPLIESRQVNISGSKSLVPLQFPEAVGEVHCRRARCALTADGVEVYAIDANTLSIGMQLRLVPAATRRIDGRLVDRENIDLQVIRCGIRAPEDAPMLAGASSHRYYVAIAADCFAGGVHDLALETRPPTVAYVKSETQSPDSHWRFFELVVDKVPKDVRQLEMTLSSREPARVSLGAFSVDLIEDYEPLGIHLSLPELGRIDFVPANRDANIEFVFADSHFEESIRVQSRRGAYEVESNEGEITKLRAAQNASGSIPLRMAYISKSLTEFLGREEPIAYFDTDSRFPLRRINIPIALTELTDSRTKVVRVECMHKSEPVEIPPGRTISIPFENRNSCRLLIDRRAIAEAAGVQHLRLLGDGLNEILQVSHHTGVIAIALPAEGKRMFDALTISVGHEYSGGHYDLSPRQNLGAEARYRVVVGDRKFRFSASTSLPTGLFRFGAERGSVPFSAGAVARTVWLYKEGEEFPIGFEFGFLGTGLSDTPHFSVVSGLGFSVPVLNPNTSLQTSFNLHAWIEYSPTRVAPDSPWAFLFGPSFAVGKFSADL